jgi:chemotaxis protein histidine kinase CheA
MTFSPEMLKELLSTFQCELEESAISLINGLVELEKAGDDKKTRTENIEIIFRTAHNLKGIRY